MWLSWRRSSFLLGVATSAVAPLLWLSGAAAVLADLAFVAVFVVGPAHQTVTALAALRRAESPIRRVVRAGVAFWAGASIGWTIGWNKALVDVVTGKRAFNFAIEALTWSWMMAAIFTVVIATVTGSVHAWRVRS